jgi:hypothetical protein
VFNGSPTTSPRVRLRDFLVSGAPPRPKGREDAEALAAAAREQGLVGILHTALLSSPEPGTWSNEVLDGMRDAHRALLVRGLHQLEQAASVQDALLAHGLRSLPLKGVAVAESLYDTVADRPMADVDLLALDDWAGSVRVLEESGFREVGRGDHARAFVDPSSGVVLELHHALTSCPGLFPLDPEGLWRRSQSGPGTVPRLPSPEDLLVHLCLHASFQHGLVLSLVQYLDLRRVQDRLHPDSRTTREAAVRTGAEAALGLALAAAAALVGGPDATQPLPPMLAGWLSRRLEDPTCLLTPAAPDLARVRFGLAAGRRFRLLAGTLAALEPGETQPPWRRSWGVLQRTARLARSLAMS